MVKPNPIAYPPEGVRPGPVSRQGTAQGGLSNQVNAVVALIISVNGQDAPRG
jgi:hypothetical protein